MNTLHDTIISDLTTAMKNREATRLETLRSIKAGFTNELVATSRPPQEKLSDEEGMAVIKRLHKQRLDAAEQFGNAGRVDLQDKELAEAKVLEEYLPEQLSDEALANLVAQVIADNPDADKSKMGIIIGQVMKAAEGKVDGKRVQQEVGKQLK